VAVAVVVVVVMVVVVWLGCDEICMICPVVAVGWSRLE